MCYPWDVDGYKLLGWSEDVSGSYLNGWNQQIEFPDIAKTAEGRIIEPEIIWYNKSRALGIQFHPEMMSYGGWPIIDYLNKLIKRVYNDSEVFNKEEVVIQM